MPLYARVCETDITPPPDVWMAGYSFRHTPAHGVHDELFARALVLDDGHTRLAIVATDLVSLDTELQPGINVITVVARESEDTTSRYTMIVRRDGPNGEALKTKRGDAFGEDLGLDGGD